MQSPESLPWREFVTPFSFQVICTSSWLVANGPASSGAHHSPVRQQPFRMTTAATRIDQRLAMLEPSQQENPPYAQHLSHSFLSSMLLQTSSERTTEFRGLLSLGMAACCCFCQCQPTLVFVLQPQASFILRPTDQSALPNFFLQCPFHHPFGSQASKLHKPILQLEPIPSLVRMRGLPIFISEYEACPCSIPSVTAHPMAQLLVLEPSQRCTPHSSAINEPTCKASYLCLLFNPIPCGSVQSA